MPILALAARKQLLGKDTEQRFCLLYGQYARYSVVHCVSSVYESCFDESCMLVLISWYFWMGVFINLGVVRVDLNTCS